MRNLCAPFLDLQILILISLRIRIIRTDPNSGFTLGFLYALWNVVIGCIGALLGGFIFDILGISTSGGLLGALITALVGAVVLLFIAKLIKK